MVLSRSVIETASFLSYHKSAFKGEESGELL